MSGPVKVSTATVWPFTTDAATFSSTSAAVLAAQLEGPGVEGHRAVEGDGQAVDHRPLGGPVVDGHARDLRRRDGLHRRVAVVGRQVGHRRVVAR